MDTVDVWFEDAKEIRPVKPLHWKPGKELRSGGIVIDRGPAVPVFQVQGYAILWDEMAQRWYARRF